MLLLTTAAPQQGNWLPLHLAACWGNKDAVELLIELFPDGAYFKDNVCHAN